MAHKAILYDESKCTACRGCQAACKQWNGLPATPTTNKGNYENPPDLSVDTWIKIKFTEIELAGGGVAWLFSRRACMHCTDAACVAVCPTEAVYHHEMGFVAYDKDKCNGCRYCLEACPFDIPRISGSKLIGWGKMDKCNFCQDRVSNGLEPACVKTCPTGALSFGDRNQLLIDANRRLNELKIIHDPIDSDSSLYPETNLYGVAHLEGLHVLYVLTNNIEKYDQLPANPKIPSVVTTWQDFLKPAGFTVAGLLAVGLGVNYMVARARMIRQKENNDMHLQEVSRFRLSTRLLHWIVTVSFLVLGLTGLFLYMPQFQIVTQDGYTRMIHRIAAVIFLFAPLIYFLARPRNTLSFIRIVFLWEKDEIRWFKAAPSYYFGGDENRMPSQGIINTGQKLWAMATFLGGICFLATGLFMWVFNDNNGRAFMYSVFIHDICFITGGSLTLAHIYLSAIHPRTRDSIRSMVTGMVSTRYAERHNSKWLRERFNYQSRRSDLE